MNKCKVCKFELCPHDTASVVLKGFDEFVKWTDVKKQCRELGYRGKFILLDRSDKTKDVIVRRINIK